MDFLTDSENENLALEDKGKDNSFIFAVPTEDKALYFKMIPNSNIKTKSGVSGVKYLEVEYFKHRIGNGEKDIREHPSAESLGIGAAPEKEAMWNYIEHRKAFPDRESKEYLALTKLKSVFEPKLKYFLWILEPGSSKIKALKVPQSVKLALYGRPAKNHSAEIPSLIAQMQNKGLTPFVDKNPDKNKKGWLKLYKTGEGLATRYVVEVATEKGKTVVDGTEVEFTKTKEYQLGDEIQNIIAGKAKFDPTTIPDVLEMERKQAWTYDESKAFVAAMGSIAGTPKRFLKTENSEDFTMGEFPLNNDMVDSGDAIAMDDIPF
jgi:hypothetical protein